MAISSWSIEHNSNLLLHNCTGTDSISFYRTHHLLTKDCVNALSRTQKTPNMPGLLIRGARHSAFRTQLASLVGEDDLDPPILRPPPRRGVFRDRKVHAVTDHLNTLGIHAQIDQQIGHGLRTRP